jgi:quercetin dioxygenase-like cupin family protein
MVTFVPNGCTIVREGEAIYRDKRNGTHVHYFIFPEYEIHANTIEPGSIQEWHHHERIVETLFVTRGSLEARWADGAAMVRKTLHVGDVIEVGRTSHTFANVSARRSAFVVFRLIPDGTDKRELIKADRVVDAPPGL